MKRVLFILALITSTQTADAQEKDRIADLEIGYVFGGYGRNTNLSNASPAAADVLSDGEGLVNGLDFRLFDPSKHGVVLKWEFNSDSSSDDYMSHWLTTMAYAYRFEFARRERGLWFAVTPSVGLTGGRTRVSLYDYDPGLEDELESFIFGANASVDAAIHAGRFFMGMGMGYSPLAHTSSDIKMSHAYNVVFRIGANLAMRTRKGVTSNQPEVIRFPAR